MALARLELDDAFGGVPVPLGGLARQRPFEYPARIVGPPSHLLGDVIGIRAVGGQDDRVTPDGRQRQIDGTPVVSVKVTHGS